MKILQVDSSSTGPDSVSRHLTSSIVEHLSNKYPGAPIARLDLAQDPIPHQGDVSIGSLRLPAEAQTAEMRALGSRERSYLDQFMASDIVVVGAPMYNFSIPSQLKAWLDRLAVPGVAFSYSEAGPKGLAGGRLVIIASSQGGIYQAGDPTEHQESLLRAFFEFIGVEDIQIIRADKVAFGPEMRSQSIAAAQDLVRQL